MGSVVSEKFRNKYRDRYTYTQRITFIQVWIEDIKIKYKILLSCIKSKSKSFCPERERDMRTYILMYSPQ